MNNNEFKTTVNKKCLLFEKYKKVFGENNYSKNSEKEARELYSILITPDITRLKNVKDKDKNKRHKILEVLENLESVFTGIYLHYKDPLSESEESTEETTKLRKQGLAEIANKEKMVDFKQFREYFKYLSPSDIYKNLNEAIDPEKNETKVNATKYNLANLMELFKSRPTSDTKNN